MAAAIMLYDPRPVAETDESGTLILKSVLPSSTKQRTLYRDRMLSPRLTRKFPSLQSFCVRALLDYPDQLHVLGNLRLRFDVASESNRGKDKVSKRDILKDLLPRWRTRYFSKAEIDPRLWANIVQIYENLPDELRALPIHLADPFLLRFQQIPSTPYFALTTVLDLSRSRNLTDESILALKALQNLSALDVSFTSLSTRGLRSLALSLIFNHHGERRGPWTLRILTMQDCRGIDDGIFLFLKDFPLLYLVDVTGTRCSRKAARATQYKVMRDHPTPSSNLEEGIQALAKAYPNAFSYRVPFILTAQEKPVREENVFEDKTFAEEQKPLHSGMHNSYVVLPSSRGSLKTRADFQQGNVDVLEWQQRKQEPEQRDNRLAWEDGRRRRLGMDPYEELFGDGIPFSSIPEFDTENDVDGENEYFSSPSQASPRDVSRDAHRAILAPNTRDLLFEGVPSSRFYTGYPTHHSPKVKKARLNPDFLLYRTPPPWSLLDSLTLETRDPSKLKDKKGKEPGAIKLRHSQKSAIKNWQLSLLNSRKADDAPPCSRYSSPTPTLVNPPRYIPPPSPCPPRLAPQSQSVHPRRSEGRSPQRPIISPHKGVEKQAESYKRPRLKLEEEDYNPFAKRSQSEHLGRPRNPFKKGVEDARAPRRSGTIQSPFVRNPGTCSRLAKVDQKQERLKPRSNAEHAKKKAANLTQGTQPKEVQAFDWNGWSGRRSGVGL